MSTELIVYIKKSKYCAFDPSIDAWEEKRQKDLNDPKRQEMIKELERIEEEKKKKAKNALSSKNIRNKLVASLFDPLKPKTKKEEPKEDDKEKWKMDPNFEKDRRLKNCSSMNKLLKICSYTDIVSSND